MVKVYFQHHRSVCYLYYYILNKIMTCSTLQGLPIVDDGNGHNFFCALRLVVDSQATDQQKLFPQSARTKCVKPLVSKFNDQVEGTAKWNELFLFEVPRKVSLNLLVPLMLLLSLFCFLYLKFRDRIRS